MRGVHLARPDSQDLPTRDFQLPFHGCVAYHIACKFLQPECCIAFRYGCVTTIFVPMPKTAMHKNHCPVTRQNDIRLSWQFADMQPEAEPVPVQETSHQLFRLRVAAAYAGHHPAAGCRIDNIGHQADNGSIICPLSAPLAISRTCGAMIRATSRMTGMTTLLPNWR